MSFKDYINETEVQVNTKTLDIRKLTVVNLKHMFGSSSIKNYINNIEKIIKQESSNHGWNVTCEMKDGKQVVLTIKIKTVDIDIL